MARGKAKAS